MWGAQNVVARKGLLGIHMVPGSFISVSITVPIVIIAGLLSGTSFVGYSLSPFSIFLLVMIGLLGQLMGRIMLYGGIKILGAARATPIASSRMLFASLFGILFLSEQITLGALFGTLLIFAGIAFITATEATRVEVTDNRWKGFLFAVLAGLFWGMTSVLTRVVVLEIGSAIYANLLANIFGIVIFGFIMSFRGYYKVVQKMTRGSLFYLLVAGCFMAVASLANFTALGLGNVVFVAPISGSAPLFTVFFSFIFIQRLEKVNLGTILGALCVVIGTYFIAASPF
jgi:uncharacterized membrane protein